MRHRHTLGAAAATALAATLLAPLHAQAAQAAQATAHTAAARYADDFNGDGYRDLAFGTPFGIHGGRSTAGHVGVAYGSAQGPGNNPLPIGQESPGVPGTAEEEDQFGQTFTSGDLDSDGYADLAVSAPYEDVGGTRDRGTVTILWGGNLGLRGGANIPDKAPALDGYFGQQMAAADFTGDGTCDLAVLQDRTVRLYKGPFTRDGKPKAVLAKRLAHEARKLVAGKVNRTAAADLVLVGEGRTEVLLGTDRGFATSRTTMAGGREAAIGDFDKDGYGDIAVSDGWADLGRIRAAGRVTVAYGSPQGISPTRRAVTFTQNTSGVPGGAEADDRFGSDVSAGDVNGDGHADLVVGAAEEDNTGGAAFLKGSPRGLTGQGARWIAQGAGGVPNRSGDTFGESVRVMDTNRDGKADIAIGDPSVYGWEGIAWSIPGRSTGPDGQNSTVIYAPGSLGDRHISVQFGGYLPD
ncbi:FG-GAP repeat protein [Streptomyces sp. XD-27]|uniref:FG-GAP repeat protein n=1 Tax=Streptomyces sp. XD-27 TaxID=3062779 RepID=UPI0026F47062|nr:FG-GAP repeat protein [Streptomyces sp. XD-27]WKX70819.1 FG-GAP repeat protein [Streptomyces sp. XD-27]